MRRLSPAIDYEPVGSMAGIMRAQNAAVDFGASDMPMPSKELAKLGLVQFPIVIGGVAVVLNVAGVAPAQMKLNGTRSVAHLSRQDPDLVRPRDRGAQSRPDAAGREDRHRHPRRRVRHDLQLHQLSRESQPPVLRYGRFRFVCAVAVQHHRARQPGRGAARRRDPERDRLCRACAGGSQQARLCADRKPGRQIHQAGARLVRGRGIERGMGRRRPTST